MTKTLRITLGLSFGEDTRSHFQQMPNVRLEREHKTGKGYVQTVPCGLCKSQITTAQDRCT